MKMKKNVKLNLVDIENENNKLSSDEILGENSSSISSENSHSKSKKSKSKSVKSRSSNSESKSKMEEGNSSIHGDNIIKSPSLIKVRGIGENSINDSEKQNVNNIVIKENEVWKELIEDKKSEVEKLKLKENNTNNNFLKKDFKQKGMNIKDNTKESSLDILNQNSKKNQINDKDYKEDVKINTIVKKVLNKKNKKEDNK